jgi:adenylosuccinate synthase
MTVTLIIGTQWGDEGKGKVVDYFSKDAEYVVRFQGGNNAGHTIKVGDQVYKLHVTPSGVIQGKTGVIGNGVVIDPEILLKEIDELIQRGLQPKLLISDRAHIIMPYHKILDGAKEQELGDKKIGTTKRGIGPCYSDKVSRNGIRSIDLTNPTLLDTLLTSVIPFKQKLINLYGIKETLNKQTILKQYSSYGKKLQKYIASTHIVLNKALTKEKKIILEGAQGTMLDVDFGTYPYTTSSHTVAGGSSIGIGLGPQCIDTIIGIVKAYTTRVGEGPLPTELSDKTGEHLKQQGHEYGTTTSRPRRCGWLDLIVVKHACQISGITKLALTKLDVLNDLPKIKICTQYKLHGTIIDYFPANIQDAQQCIPVYKEFKGWNKIDTTATSVNDLPEEAQTYINFIQNYLKVPFCLISIGPGRKETIEY